MRAVFWIGFAWLGVVFWSAVGSRMTYGSVLPDACIVTLAFYAMRRSLAEVGIGAIVLGYLVGRQAVAPAGLHETALVLCTFGMYVFAAQVATGGAMFFALVCGAATAAYHLLLFVLLYAFAGDAGFASWLTAALLPSALATAALGLCCYPFFLWLETRTVNEPRRELLWR